jgi:RNA polymerase sigma-70 factor (ECF subfamily)
MDTLYRNVIGSEPEPRAGDGDRSLSAEQVFHDFAPRVLHMARKMVNGEADAEDVTQEVLLQVVRKLPSFRGEAAFPTWLHRITINAALSHRRKRAVREEGRIRDPLDALLEDDRQVPASRGTQGPDVLMETRETRVLIERAIAGLPEIYRNVFVLADVEGWANAAIADSLGLTLPAIKSRLHRARLLMRESLAPHFDEVMA